MTWRDFNPNIGHWYELTKEERTKALKYLMYLKEERDERIKGRGYTDGRLHQEYTKNISTSSPTVSLAAIMFTFMLDAFEKRDVATVDTSGAFLLLVSDGKVRE